MFILEDHPTSADFQAAIEQCIAQAHSYEMAELESLLTLKFQTFTEAHALGRGKGRFIRWEETETGASCLPSSQLQEQQKVSSKAV